MTVTIEGMRYLPSEVRVNRGDRLVVELVNTGTTTHDLVIGAARTPRIGPGKRVELDAGVISASITGYCSVAGHRQLGMVPVSYTHLDVYKRQTPTCARRQAWR